MVSKWHHPPQMWPWWCIFVDRSKPWHIWGRQFHMKFQHSLISSWWWSQILLPVTAAVSSPGASNRPKLKSCFWLKLYAASSVLREHQDVWWKYLCSDITLNWPQPPAMHEQHLISSFSYWVDTVPTVSSQANVVKSR